MNKVSYFRSIIVPVLNGCDYTSALRMAQASANDGNVILVGLVRVPENEPLSSGEQPARRMRSLLRAQARKLRLQGKPLVFVTYQPLQELITFLQAEQPSLVMLQSPDQVEALSVTAEELMQQIPCDMALVHGSLESRPRKVLVCLRGGPHAELALRLALSIESEGAARITSLHITSGEQDQVRETPFRGLSVVLDHMPEIEHVESTTGDPASVILQASRSQDLVIVGASAPSEPDYTLIGPVLERVLNECKTGVVIVKTARPISRELASDHVGRNAISILVDKWFARNTHPGNAFADLDHLLKLKQQQGLTISLALPALNEEKTVGHVIQTVRSALMDEVPLLDEIVLMDSDSQDQTRQIAADLGVPVYIHQQVLPEYGARRGKGEALWKSLYVTRGDILLWIDTDIVNIHPRFVYSLIGPLLSNPNIQFVKGFYRRPLRVGDKIQAGGGGRVTELTARPLINLFYPELSGVIQPLSGEYGGRRSALERLPFFSGYGVEIGLLIDMVENFGLNAIAQVDLKRRVHHNQPLEALSKMSFAIIQAVSRKLEKRFERNILEEVNKTMKLVHYASGRFTLDVEEIAERERPAMIELPEYRMKIHHSKP